MVEIKDWDKYKVIYRTLSPSVISGKNKVHLLGAKNCHTYKFVQIPIAAYNTNGGKYHLTYVTTPQQP